MTLSHSQRNSLRVSFLVLSVLLSSSALFAHWLPIASVYAGVFDDESGATYKEIWIDHNEFTGGCGDHERPDGTWYVEPERKGVTSCLKFLDFTFPDDFAQATKIEIFIDIWRGHDEFSVRFEINGNGEHASTVGADWSRTPLVKEIAKDEFVAGTNTIQVWKGTNAYHIHDIGFRLYYDTPNQLAGEAAPSAELLTVQAANGTFPARGTNDTQLDIDNDTITLTAGNVSEDAEFIEFYAFYEGYDEDADGVSRDWHNRTRNNCHDGGSKSKCPQASTAELAMSFHGTIDHVGTVRVTNADTYAISWDVTQIPAQRDVRFKIRVLDADHNARDAAGGVSSTFTLKRTKAVAAFVIPDFVDAVLHGAGTKPDLVTRFIDLPPDVDTYDEAYMIGSYWKNPYIALNENDDFRAFTNGEDDWTLSVREISLSHLQAGRNKIEYIHKETQGNWGEFIEKPGPMIVLKRTQSTGEDTTPPWAHAPSPAENATDVALRPELQIRLYDSESGVDKDTITLLVNGQDVTSNIQVGGEPLDYKVSYIPATSFARNTVVTVEVAASDGAGNAMVPVTYSFTTAQEGTPPARASDDFNVCVLDTDRWTWYPSAQNDGSLSLTTKEALMTVPAGAAHDIANGKNSVPRLVQPVANRNLDIVAKYDSTFAEITNPAQGTATQGLLVGKDGDFIRLAVARNAAGDPELSLRIFKDDSPISSNQKTEFLAGEEVPSYLRIKRRGNTWTIYYSHNGSNWTTFKSFSRTLTVAEMGPYVGNSGTNPPAYTAVLDYFFDRDEPFAADDAVALLLPVTVEGVGTVTKDVDCGNPVQLTAEPAAGWSFTGYSGAISSTMPIESVAFMHDDTVTATFTQEQYTLTALQGGTGSGTVTKTPDQPTYLYNDMVQLTAQADVGSTFNGWSGAVSSLNPTITLTVTDHTTVTALITRNAYTLTTRTAGPGTGTVVRVPDQATYTHGDVVELMAQPALGSQFVGWIDGLFGVEPTATVTMTGHLTTTALFTPTLYTINTATVGSGRGTVTQTPAQSTYRYGDTVTLHAQANPGSTFTGWRGDISSAMPTVTITITNNISAAAAFTENEYTLDITTTGSGTAEWQPQKSVYRYGDMVQLAATPSAGWTFASWRGDLLTTTNPVAVFMDGSKTIMATFTQGKYTLATNVVGNGSIVLDPLQAVYQSGDVVQLMAQPGPGAVFTGWQGDRSGTDNPTTLTISGNHVVTATFSQQEYTLTIDDVVGGSISVSPQKATYTPGEVVTLEAKPNDEWVFLNWTGDVTGNSVSTTITMDGNKQAGARFLSPNYTVSVVAATGGFVTMMPAQAEFTHGDTVTVAATPEPGWTFMGWHTSTGFTSGANPATIAITASQIITGSFTQAPIRVMTETVGEGMIIASPEQAVYTMDAQVTLTAVPASGWYFARWVSSDDSISGVSATESTITIAVRGETTYRAVFAQLEVEHHTLLPLIATP